MLISLFVHNTIAVVAKPSWHQKIVITMNTKTVRYISALIYSKKPLTKLLYLTASFKLKRIVDFLKFMQILFAV